MNKKRMAIIFAAAIFACVLSVGIFAVADESKMVPGTDAQEQPSYTEYPGEIGDIAKRAEAQIKEINEVSELEKEKLEKVKREQYFEDYKEETAGSLLSKNDIAELEARRAQKENAIRTKVGYEIQSLEAEPTAQQGVSPAGPRPRTSSQTSSRGMVTGIVFYNNSGAALVAGEIVRENDVVLGVKVLKVTADYVEFEKQGSKWKQAVGQAPPSSYWEQPQTQKSAPTKQPSATTKTKTGK
jgi:Spy/CpxP family protein refolding chaperone